MFITEDYIKRCLESEIYEIETLDKIARYVDIKKPLFMIYDSSKTKQMSDIEISSQSYILFLNLLINSRDFKLLNSACKLNDFLVQRNILNSEEHKRNLDSIINTVLENRKIK